MMISSLTDLEVLEIFCNFLMTHVQKKVFSIKESIEANELVQAYHAVVTQMQSEFSLRPEQLTLIETFWLTFYTKLFPESGRSQQTTGYYK